MDGVILARNAGTNHKLAPYYGLGGNVVKPVLCQRSCKASIGLRFWLLLALTQTLSLLWCSQVDAGPAPNLMEANFLRRYLKQAAPGQTSGADDDARREACRLGLAFAQRWNAWLEEASAQASINQTPFALLVARWTCSNPSTDHISPSVSV